MFSYDFISFPAPKSILLSVIGEEYVSNKSVQLNETHFVSNIFFLLLF
jgi:hypothetical protein